MTAPLARLTGGCSCGEITWAATASPFQSLICHCSDCRAATARPASGYLAFAKAHVTWSAARAFTRTSPGTTRGACPACRTPLSTMTTRYPGELYIHAATLDAAHRFEPGSHRHWASRVPGTDADDTLPRHSGWAA